MEVLLFFLLLALPFSLGFSYSEFTREDKEIRLKSYGRIGKRICQDPNFIESPVFKLKEALKRPLISKTLLDRIAKESNRPDITLTVDTMFIALIAPSLAGKTQCAFAMEELRPLYFALEQTSDTLTSNTQSIYLNFHSLSETLKKVGTKDLERIKQIATKENKTLFDMVLDAKVENFNGEEVTADVSDMSKKKGKFIKDYDEKDENEVVEVVNPDTEDISNPTPKMSFKDLGGIYAEISVNKLSNHESYKDVKYFTLGFLMKLAEEGNALFVDDETSGQSWMEFHAHRGGDRSELYYSAISISEARAKRDVFEKYFLFLDEFVGHPWAVLIRNLARAIGLGTIVANTNSDIGNLTGYAQAASSGDEANYVAWSYIVTKLNPFYWIEPISDASAPQDRELSVSLESKLMRKVTMILNNCPDDLAKNGLKIFFDNLKDEFCLTRPGVFEFVAFFIENVSVDKPFTALSFIDSLFRFTAKKVGLRKNKILGTGYGRLANLGLLLSNSYVTEVEKTDFMFHKKSFLKNHLYYLLNPVDKDDWAFLTFRPSEKGESLQVYKDGRLDDWMTELTFLRDTELLTILSCMFIVSKYSTIEDIVTGECLGKRGNPSLSSNTNPLAIKLDGNRLETLASVSLIDSSHHSLGSMHSTLSGQNGKIFIHNLLNNLISSREAGSRRNKKCEMIISSNLLENFLASIEVPFLYAANCTVPELLQKLTRSNCGINVGECKRTADKDKIDFKLDLFKTDKGKRFAVGECKNWALPVPVPKIIEAIQKAWNTKDCILNLIFCTEMNDFETSRSKLHEMANVSIYMTVKHENKITWIPIRERLDPDIVVLIFESSVIDS